MISMFICFSLFFSSLHPNLVPSQAGNVRAKRRQYLEIVTGRCIWLLCCCKNSWLILTPDYKSRKKPLQSIMQKRLRQQNRVVQKPRLPGSIYHLDPALLGMIFRLACAEIVVAVN